MTVPAFPPEQIEVVDHLLTTTRAIRRRFDLGTPVDKSTLEECIRLATHAPSAENQQNWRWIVVTDPDTRKQIADCYWRAWVIHRSGGGGKVRRRSRSSDGQRNVDSVAWLAENVGDVPAMVIPCVLGRPPVPGRFAGRNDPKLDHLGNLIYYGSVLPAIWSFQLALRSRGLGSVITCMHLPFESEVSETLGIPGSVTQVCLLPVAYMTGESVGRAPRTEPLIGWDGWSDAL